MQVCNNMFVSEKYLCRYGVCEDILPAWILPSIRDNGFNDQNMACEVFYDGALTECFQSARVSATHSWLTEFRAVEGVDARLTSA